MIIDSNNSNFTIWNTANLSNFPNECFSIYQGLVASVFFHCDYHKSVKVATRVEKTDVFRKGWIFANRTYFASCMIRKYYNQRFFFPYFYHGIIFYSAELFYCTVNFKFYSNIFIFLNINTNQTSKEQYLN